MPIVFFQGDAVFVPSPLLQKKRLKCFKFVKEKVFEVFQFPLSSARELDAFFLYLCINHEYTNVSPSLHCENPEKELQDYVGNISAITPRKPTLSRDWKGRG